jgi:hypothetical protein
MASGALSTQAAGIAEQSILKLILLVPPFSVARCTFFRLTPVKQHASP